MANRNMFHKSKLEEFKKYLESKDIEWRETPADFQVMQVKTHAGWSPVFYRHTGDHYTVQWELLATVRDFIKQSV